MYVADVACRALVTVSSSAAAGTAPAESGITVGMRAPVKYNACNLISLLLLLCAQTRGGSTSK